MEIPVKRTLKDYAFLMSKGMAMGAADVVPGVSGGTVAFISGIYDELLYSLKQCGPAALMILFRRGFAEFWRHINGYFLLAVFGGILISLKTFASIIGYCLDNYPLLVWGFFSGLIAASVFLLARDQKGWRWSQWFVCAIGIFVVVGVSIFKPTQLPGHWWMLFLGGFVAICAMILPGVSGSFILLLVGLYPVFLAAISDLNLVALASFGAGCVCGLLVFSRFLSWLLSKYHSHTIACLIGFLIGSLNVTWPWKQTVTSITNRHGEVVPLQQSNVSPWTYAELANHTSQLLAVIGLAVAGVVLVLLFELLAGSKSSSPNKE